MEWFVEFWKKHGERLIFLGLATVMALAFVYLFPDKMGETGLSMLGAIAMLFINKARSPDDKKD